VSRGVALPPGPRSVMPGVWAELAVDRGPLAALVRLEEAEAHARVQADRLEVEGKHELAAVYRTLSDGFKRDIQYFCAVHA
jgi:hypothetical protein